MRDRRIAETDENAPVIDHRAGWTVVPVIERANCASTCSSI
jgi:hypothetical protein